ncbi:MAG TPA: hypothetical protein VGH98_15965 [Gemmatimonadaceae bacterium]|jgi:hypothetical protein
MNRFAGILILLPSIAGAQQQPPMRQLGAITAKSAVSFNAIVAVRALPGGRLLVDDMVGRKVVLLDSSLAQLAVVADTTSATATAYSGRIASIIPYRADSTLFVDPQSMSMMVIDPSGKMTSRVMALPRSEDAGMLGGIQGGSAGLDAKGRLVYRAPFRVSRTGPPPTGSNGLPLPPSPPDSAMIVRVDLATRRLDTVGVIKTPKLNVQVSQDDKGNVRMSMESNPLPVVDDWAVLSDGSVAFVRGRDYHIDFANADGSKTSAPKIPFDWQRLTDEDKVAFIDSVKAARERLASSNPAAPTPAGAPAGANSDGGRQRMVIQMGPDGGRAGGGTFNSQAQVNFVSPSELPDYKPPFFANSVRGDASGNIWVRTIPTKQIPGGPVYDVINHEGKLVDHVQIPANHTIIGFGADGSVYLVTRDTSGPTPTMTLERALLR